MAGDARLEGDLGVKALRMLDDIATVLERYSIDYTLDCGTLLGAVRENRILPWDNDMDLCVKADQLGKLRKAFFHLWFKGYRVRFAKAFFPFGPIAAGAPRILKVRNRKGVFHRGELLLDIFIKYPDKKGNLLLMVGEKQASIVQSFEESYMDEKIQFNFSGRLFPIPKNYDEYLTARYGDWRIPVKEWDFIRDDQSKIDNT